MSHCTQIGQIHRVLVNLSAIGLQWGFKDNPVNIFLFLNEKLL